MAYHARSLLWPEIWENLLRAGFDDDHSQWDWTTIAVVGTRKSPIRARVLAKEDGVWAASGLLGAVEKLGNLKISCQIQDGGSFKRGQILCEWQGSANSILGCERPFLNLASYASGIATRTSYLVKQVKKACPKKTPRVTSTRKILPFYRDLVIHSVIAGGGHSHRLDLSGGVLIKENHIAASGGIAKAVRLAREIAPHSLKIEIEVRSQEELTQAIEVGADSVLLDNFTPAQVKAALKALKSISKPPVIEISGGLHEANIADYAIEGVDVLSVGSLSHSVKAIDLSLLMEGT